MRIAVNYQRVDPSKGGAETYVADLCRSLVNLGHEVDLYANAWKPGVLPTEVRCERVKARGWIRMWRLWSFARNSERALKAARPYDCTIGFINTWHHDVIIPQGGVHKASREANARRFRNPVSRLLYVAAKALNPRAWVYHAIEKRQYDPARKAVVIAVSHMVRGHLERFHGVTRERIHVIPNAIDDERLAVADPQAMRAEVRKRLGLTETDLVALFVGHNFKLKGLPPLLDVLAFRQRRDPQARPIHLLVCGGGKLEPFRRIVERLGLSETVHLIGFLPDVREGFHAADFFVSPTYYDPCSLVVFEALATGLPVITTACNGAGEVISEGQEGFVIPTPTDLPVLADALDAMTDDAVRKAMSERARRLGMLQSFENHVSQLIHVFEGVAVARRATSPHQRSKSVSPSAF